MITQPVTIINRLGMHARAAAKFATTASKYPCAIYVESGGRRVNGKSIMGLMMLAATRGTEITLSAEGDDEAAAITALISLVNHRFGEAE